MSARGLLLLAALLCAGCASTTVIRTDPPGAQVIIDGRPAGESPVTHTDRKIVAMSTMVNVRKDGYLDVDTSFRRNEVWNPGSLMLGFLYWPLLWCRGYDDSRIYVLEPLGGREWTRFDQSNPYSTAKDIGSVADSGTGKEPGAVNDSAKATEHLAATETEFAKAAKAARLKADQRKPPVGGDGREPIEVGGEAHIAIGAILFLGGFATSLASLRMDQGDGRVQLLEASAYMVWVGGLFELVHGFKEVGRKREAARRKQARARARARLLPEIGSPR